MTIEQTTLENGLRVVTWALPGLETAAIGLTIDTGSRFEAAEVNGVAHMLEHMVFKGTRRRSARRIAEEIEAVGGQLNAFTGRDITSFYARVLAGDLPLGLDMVADLITEPLLDPDELTREREVVLQELGQAIDTPDDIVFDHLYAAAFPGQGLGRAVLGTEPSIRAIDRPALVDWLDRQYRAGSMVLTAAGKVDHAAIVAMARDRLGGIAAGVRANATAPEAVLGGEQRDERALEQVQVALALPGPHYTDPDYYPLMLFATALGGGMSSRLFQEVREERGLVYSIYSYVSAYADTGYFGVSFATGEELAQEAATRTMATMAQTATGLDAAELARAKAQVKAGLLMGLESCTGMIEQMARQLLLIDRVTPTAEIVARIDAVTLEEVRASARYMLQRADALALATVGPSQTVPDRARLAGWLA